LKCRLCPLAALSIGTCEWSFINTDESHQHPHGAETPCLASMDAVTPG